MPFLNWAGKENVLNSHKDVSFHFLEKNDKMSTQSSENMLIEGDNLIALKSLLPYYKNKIKCVFIDPPYNTGNTTWTYDDLLHHDKWLDMMFPRLRLLRELLKMNGLIFITISDHEQHNLRSIMDEIFGSQNFIGTVIWNSTKTVTNTALVSVSHTYLIIYAKNIDYIKKNRKEFRLPDTEEGFENPDNDEMGPWKADPFQVEGVRPNQQYGIKNPKTGKIYKPNDNCSWKNDFKNFKILMAQNRIVFGKNGIAGPQRKRYLSEALERGRVTKTLWVDLQTTSNATTNLKKMFGKKVFTNPKPVDLIEKIIQLGAPGKNDIILDSFAGSGTTAHAVLSMNNKYGGSRQFICVELEKKICRNITRLRIKKAIEGYDDVEGLGGGFSYIQLGEALFNKQGIMNAKCTKEQIAQHIFLTETGNVLERLPNNSRLLGKHNNKAYYMIFDGHGKKNMLNHAELKKITSVEKRIVYADRCIIQKDKLLQKNIIFKQIPYGVKIN